MSPLLAFLYRQTRKWLDQSDQDRYTTEVVVNIGGSMQMLGGNGDNQAGSQKPAQQPQQTQQHRQQQPQTHQPEPPLDFNNDIPF